MVEGYTNSQTWEAWKDSFNVLWDNTEVVFLLSVTVSLGAVLITWLFYPKAKSSLDNVLEVAEEVTTYDSAPEEDEIEETLMEHKKKPSIHELTSEIENSLTVDEKKMEREAQSKQLEVIFQLMQEQEEKFGQTSMDDIQDQMKFYCR